MAKIIEKAKYGKQNISRLRSQIKKERAIIQRNDILSLNIKYREKLDKVYSSYLKNKPIKKSDSVLFLDNFSNTRSYIYNVVFQINASYDSNLMDCCAVMCRRLLETLMIETLIKKGLKTKIYNNGNFLPYKELLKMLKAKTNICFGKTALRGLESFKRVADRSAHDIKFNAKKSRDIDPYIEGIEAASNELLLESNLKN